MTIVTSPASRIELLQRFTVRFLQLQIVIVGLCILFFTPTAHARPKCPTNLDWLRKLCGDGALAYEHYGRIYLTELSTGKTEFVGKGNRPEFSPDSSKLAWIDGSTAKGRMRKGDTTVHTIAAGVDRGGGVHWLSNTEVVVVLKKGKRKGWYCVSLSGERRELRELTRLGAGGFEADVKLGEDGVWSYVSRTTWKTSDGKSGHIDGNCSSSLSPDGRSTTALQGDHRTCKLTAIRKGGVKGQLKWVYDGTFDNHRWSSNDPRFVVFEEEKYKRMVIMEVGSNNCTYMGDKGVGKDKNENMYGDFTVGDGQGTPWGGNLSKQSPSSGLKAIGQKPKPVVLANSWPGNTNGLTFLWENNRQPNEIFDVVQQKPLYCNGIFRGLARFDRYHEMNLSGGAFHVDDVDSRLLSACKKANQLSIEAVITPDNLQQSGPARIISFSSSTSSRNFTLGQEKNKLVLRLRTPKTGDNGSNPQVSLCAIKAGQPHHIVVTYRPGLLVCYLNGEQILSTKSIKGNFSNWSPQHLLFGDEWGGDRDWSGRLEGIAIYSRFITPEEAKHNHALYAKQLRNRKPVERSVVQAKLLEITPTPTVESLQEYQRALVVHTYRIQKILKGKVDSKKILVAHWAFLDRKLVPSIKKKKVGATYKLELEKFDDNPQLESELQFNDSEDFDLPLYYDSGGI